MNYTIKGLILQRTCSACPEQYDAYDPAGKVVGYFRLRHGSFTVETPYCGGAMVYRKYTEIESDGCFDTEHERLIELTTGVDAIFNYLGRKSLGLVD